MSLFLLGSVLADFPILVPILVVIGGMLLLAAGVWSMYKVAEPNEALIISGLGAHGDTADRADSLGFKIVSGKGSIVLPVVQTVRSLSLDLRTITVELESVTKQSIPVVVRGVVIFKVADDFPSIANAARRFLGKQEDMDSSVKQLAHGQLRTIIGSLTVEELIRDREALRAQVLTACQDEMEKLGLHIDSFQIQEIADVHDGSGQEGYIKNLGRPQAASVARDARIAEAERAREAMEKEQAAKAATAEAIKESEVRQALALAETEKARAEAQQAGPLAEATARQQVIEANTRAAELEASLTEQRLQTEVRRPADARAYEQVTIAEAQREAAIKQAQAEAESRKLAAQADAEATKALGDADAHATRARGEAEAEAVKAKALAEASGIEARNKALAENSSAVIEQQIAENLPAIVEAAAKQYSNVDQLIVLDGAEGLNKSMAGTIAAAGALLPVAKGIISGKDKAAAKSSGEPRAKGYAGGTPDGFELAQRDVSES